MEILKLETVCITGPKHPLTLNAYTLLRGTSFHHAHFFTAREDEEDLRMGNEKNNGKQPRSKRTSNRIKEFGRGLATSLSPRLWTFRDQVPSHLLEKKTVIRYSLGDWRIVSDFVSDNSPRRRYYARVKSLMFPSPNYEEYDLVIWLRLSLAVIRSRAEEVRGRKLSNRSNRFLKKKFTAFERKMKKMGDKCLIVEINLTDNPFTICDRLCTILQERGVQ